MRWLHRAGADPASGGTWSPPLESVDLPAGRGPRLPGRRARVWWPPCGPPCSSAAWTAEQISAKPYWRAGRANAAHGEPERP